MEWPLLKALLWGLFVFLRIRGQIAGCLREERIALLELKAFLEFNIIHADADDHRGLLPSWIDDAKSDCCGWERVTCNSTTAHVIKLSLYNLTEQDPYNNRWLLNVSLLVPLKELTTLDLSRNAIRGSLPNEGFESLSRLENLETLDLSHNNFNRSIIELLSSVKSLKNLNLASNRIEGSFPAKGLSNFSRLEILDLNGNSFTGSISPYIGALSSLKAISLGYNDLNGTLPKELCKLNKLEELELYGNLFEGILPPCLNNMTSLRLLDICENQFAGNISSNLIAIPTSLEYIDLSYNLFEGLFSFSLFANHSKLEVIILVNNNSKLEIETENSSGWDDLSFQSLKVIVLRDCNLNKPTGNVPKFLFDQRELEIVDLSHNKLKGMFPNWLLENNTGLQELNLRNNSFVGQIHLPPNCYKSISFLDVSDNCLDGQLQENIGKIIPYLKYLNLSQNVIEGYLPSSIGDLRYLESLDLSFNNFSGELPTELFATCTSLNLLKLCNNQFTGTIPRWIGNMTRLLTFILSNNFFEGQIPCGLDSVQLVDLSHNSLSGSLPSCLNLRFVEHLRLQGNKLTGPIPKAIFNSSSLLTLDLRDNSFFGSIPDEIGALYNLRILLLRGNYFSGIIPNQLCWLNKIGIMDLSKNSLSGTIPHCFHNMSFGNIDDLVYYRYPSMTWFIGLGSTFQRLQEWNWERDNMEMWIEYDDHVEVEFVTKHRSNSYSGYILNYMAGLDLSCNKLTGTIPPELGELSSIHALNLSYNQLTGSIPQKISNLDKLESLDLSHNNLSGEIPSVLIDMNFLGVFTVAYNNLSGKVPDMKAQFATFDKSSYEGNPFLCGQPLENRCTKVDESHPSPTKSSNASEGKWYEIDPQVFFASFTASYIVFFLGVATLRYIRLYWQ